MAVKRRPKTPVDIAATQLSVGDAKFIMNAAQPIELLSENFNGRNAQRCFLTHRRFSRMRRGFRGIGTGQAKNGNRPVAAKSKKRERQFMLAALINWSSDERVRCGFDLFQHLILKGFCHDLVVVDTSIRCTRA